MNLKKGIGNPRPSRTPSGVSQDSSLLQIVQGSGCEQQRATLPGLKKTESKIVPACLREQFFGLRLQSCTVLFLRPMYDIF